MRHRSGSNWRERRHCRSILKIKIWFDQFHPDPHRVRWDAKVKFKNLFHSTWRKVSSAFASMPWLTSTHSSSHGSRSSKSRYIRTLHPEKLRSAGQQILTLSGRRSVLIKLGSSENSHLQVVFDYSRPRPDVFPAETEGVFYYHSAEAHIRFRLCKTLQEFDGGSDLMLPNSRVWNLSLATMARNPARYAAFLALVKAEFPIASQDVDPYRDNHRLVSTFSPKKLVTMDQRVFNISGLPKIQISPRGKASSCIYYTASTSQGVFQDRPFPNNTTGVFYYHQSDTSPTRLGELRFRLCSDIRTFDTGSDLLLPSGQPWFISAQSLRLTHKLQSVREHLVDEGLLEHDLYPGVPDSMLAHEVTPLTSLGQPFVVDVSATRFKLNLVSPNPQVAALKLDIPWTFRKSALKEPLFSGRAIVCPEQYPASVSPRSKYHNPVFALRVLEFLAPMKRLSTSNDILDPIPGQLVMHRYPKTLEYIPWGYSPKKPDTRAAITDWIHAQSNARMNQESK